MPTCVQIKHHLDTRQAKRIIQRASGALLRERIQHTRRSLSECSEQLLALHLELGRILNAADWDTIDRITYDSSRNTQSSTRKKQENKYEKLHSRQHPTSGPYKDHSVINLTDSPLDEATNAILSKGLNFALAPKAIPTEKIITGVESAIRRLPKTEADAIREDVAATLRKARPPKQNTTRAERMALRKLKENTNILVLPADKGNATVVMERKEYDSKVRALLQETTYRVLRTDPTAKTIREAKEIIKKSSIPREELRTLLPTAPKPPRFYGLPKVHKEGIPLRPIVSQIDAPTYHLARYLARHLQPHVGKTSSHVKNSAHFVEILQGVTMEDKDIMVSFDVESLFTNVPIDDSLEIIRGLQTKGFPEDYANLVEFCLRKTYFTWNGQMYEQTEGASMGSPLSPVVANLFMEKFEAEAMDSYRNISG
ncbi:uncharacterized protein LOC124161442 [Ischnura elegans]|uniref:uncharacterized protein LOC124161442 n=1 Tax=Ischnura elegans TaxID=197161 RepID=UPI001ED8A02A|nr:uncharacterized protein LOC124161442 [Ischnura elegans]